MKRSTEYRRHQSARAEAHAYKVIKYSWHHDRYSTDEEIHDQAKRLKDHLAVCSCMMCRNPRRSIFFSREEQRTIQERRAFQEDYYEEGYRVLATLKELE